MISSCISYKLETGEIVGVMTAPQGAIAMAIARVRDGEGAIAVSGHIAPDVGATQYVVDGVIIDRPTMGVSIEGYTIRGIPAGATLWIDNSQYALNDTGFVELDLGPGSYAIKIERFPYLPLSTRIEK